MQVEPCIAALLEILRCGGGLYMIWWFWPTSDWILTTYQTCIVTDTEDAKFCTFYEKLLEW